jgi:hypothetical protein
MLDGSHIDIRLIFVCNNNNWSVNKDYCNFIPDKRSNDIINFNLDIINYLTLIFCTSYNTFTGELILSINDVEILRTINYSPGHIFYEVIYITRNDRDINYLVIEPNSSTRLLKLSEMCDYVSRKNWNLYTTEIKNSLPPKLIKQLTN